MIVKKDIDTYGARQRILLQADEFICLRPHPHLRQYISNYNITFPTRRILPDSFTEMPSGCATLVVENDSRNLFVQLDGPATKPRIVGNRANGLDMLVTIEFKPAGLYTLTGISQWELVNESSAFEAVTPKLNKLIADAVEKAESVYELVASFDKLLIDNMIGGCHPQLIQTMQNIVACSGTMRIKKLSDEAYYSERQLNRMFKQHVGVSAKSFSRLIRINSAFHLLKKSNNSLTWVSDVLGFHDFSHFVRDFTAVCGISPQAYRNTMSDFYINTTKF